MHDDQKKKFLHDELFSLTLMATVQRGHIYKASATALDKALFQNALRRELVAMALSYATTQVDQ